MTHAAKVTINKCGIHYYYYNKKEYIILTQLQELWKSGNLSEGNKLLLIM